MIIYATTLYVVLGGLYSVLVTDVVQTVILTLGSMPAQEDGDYKQANRFVCI